MGKPPRNHKLAVVFGRELNSNMFAESGRLRTEVYGNVQNGSFQNPHQLCLRIFSFLKMKAAGCSVDGLRLIILDKIVVQAGFGKSGLIPAFKK